MNVAGLAGFVAVLATSGVACAANGVLVAMVQTPRTTADRSFADRGTAGLGSVAEGLGLELRIVDVSDGAPPGITSTPAIVYVDHRGRSVYQGRWSTPGRVRNFARTSRVTPQEDQPLVLENIAVRRDGRAKIATPLKITTLLGTPPEGFDADAFAAEARDSIVAGLDGFRLAPRVELGRTDRRFYVDVHPYRADDGTLFVSTALFSQFHCHDPVYRSPVDTPFSGPWAERHAVFAEAGATLAARIIAVMTESTIGDGCSPIADDVPSVSWDDLGVSLPAAPPPSEVPVPVDMIMPSRWIVDAEAGGDEPAVQFRFPAPLDGYAGEAATVDGWMTIGPDGLTAATGLFRVDIASVTMGEPDLDAYLMGAGMLERDEHPRSRFTLRRLVPTDPGATLAPATIVPVALHGTFELKGRTIDLVVAAQLEVVAWDDGRPRLLLDGSWQIDVLEPFGMYGPDGGPPGTGRTLLYTCRIVLAPAG